MQPYSLSPALASEAGDRADRSTLRRLTPRRTSWLVCGEIGRPDAQNIKSLALKTVVASLAIECKPRLRNPCINAITTGRHFSSIDNVDGFKGARQAFDFNDLQHGASSRREPARGGAESAIPPLPAIASSGSGARFITRGRPSALLRRATREISGLLRRCAEIPLRATCARNSRRCAIPATTIPATTIPATTIRTATIPTTVGGSGESNQLHKPKQLCAVAAHPFSRR